MIPEHIDNADAARVPDYYKHGANEYRRGFDDGLLAAKEAAMRGIERGLGLYTAAAEDIIDPRGVPTGIVSGPPESPRSCE